jgi:hypothetical protein
MLCDIEQIIHKNSIERGYMCLRHQLSSCTKLGREIKGKGGKELKRN